MELDPIREALIADHAFLIPIIARTIWRAPEPNLVTDDLHSAGMLALVLAVDNRDPERNDGQWEYFVRLKIRGAMLDTLQKNDWNNRRNLASGPGYPHDVPENKWRRDKAGERAHAQASIAIDRLREPDRAILQAGLANESSRAIALRLHITEGRVSQIRRRGVERVREILQAAA